MYHLKVTTRGTVPCCAVGSLWNNGYVTKRACFMKSIKFGMWSGTCHEDLQGRVNRTTWFPHLEVIACTIRKPSRMYSWLCELGTTLYIPSIGITFGLTNFRRVQTFKARCNRSCSRMFWILDKKLCKEESKEWSAERIAAQYKTDVPLVAHPRSRHTSTSNVQATEREKKATRNWRSVVLRFSARSETH